MILNVDVALFIFSRQYTRFDSATVSTSSCRRHSHFESCFLVITNFQTNEKINKIFRGALGESEKKMVATIC